MTAGERKSVVRAEHGSMITTIQRLSEMDIISGLDGMEVRTRRARGEGNDIKLSTSRSLTDILRQNVFTLINIVLFSLGTILVLVGRITDAVTSVGLIVMNVSVGIFQEIRAKRKLDRIALLTRPKVSVIRESEERQVDPSELVRGDILVVRPGDQIVVDGIVIGDGQFEVDESLLTGETDLILKDEGDSVLSGSFCVTGSGMFVARRVGTKSFANKLAADAREFRIVRTPLQNDVDFVIRLLMMVAMFFMLLLAVSATISDIPLMRGVQTATVIAGLVPNGLFFMVIVTYAMGALRITTQGALIQQANSVESLSNVSVLCMDKTGTLTANQIEFHALVPIDIEEDELKQRLGDFAASASNTNKTSEAVAAALPGRSRRVVDEVPFSSARKWSALAFHTPYLQGVYVLGALEVLQPYLPDEAGFLSQADEWADQGLRVLLFAHNPNVTTLHDAQNLPVLPPLVPLGLIALSDVLRPEVKHTLAGFAQAGVQLKIISGDNPHTVAALAKQAGVPGDLAVIAGPDLDDLHDSDFERVVEETTVFGRITPRQKERLVDTLRAKGYYVAMIGDGVNDVLSLKKANVGIAMESGSAATRSVADMVLLGDSFAALPPAFSEGQRITSGMRDILRLYLARAVQIVLTIIAASIVGVGFPFLPSQINLVALVNIGIPTFAIAVWARPIIDRRGLLLSVLHFALPAGMLMAVFSLLIYVFAFDSVVNRGRSLGVIQQDIATFQTYAGIDYEIFTEDQFVYEVGVLFAQTYLTVFSVFGGLVLLLFVEPPVRWFVGGDRYSGDKRPALLAVVLLAFFILVMVVPTFRQFFDLLPLAWYDYAIISGAVAVWTLLLRYVWRSQLFERWLNLNGIVDFDADEWRSS